MFVKLAEKARSVVSVPDVVEQSWIKCESFVVSSVAGAYEENVVSDEGFSGVMESVYELLPLPLRLLLSREKFLTLSLSHRDVLLEKASEYRQSRVSTVAIAQESDVVSVLPGVAEIHGA